MQLRSMRLVVLRAAAATAAFMAVLTTYGDIYVATSGDNSSGADWGTALTSIQAALDAAQPGDTIFIKGEVFDITAQITWTKSHIKALGGYLGNTLGGLPGERNISLAPTIIRRDGTTNHRVMQLIEVTDSVLEGLVFCNGLTSEKTAGAGLHITSCYNLLICACAVEGNTALNTIANLGFLEGAGVYAYDSYITFSNCLVAANTNQTLYGSTVSHAVGGGMALLGGEVTVSECLIRDNFLVAARNSFGAGIYVSNGNHRIENTVIQGNYSAQSAGGISYNYGDGLLVNGAATKALLYNSVVAGNYRDGVHLNNGVLHVVNCTITGHGRYGVSRAAGTLAVTNSILWLNNKDVNGNAILACSIVGDGTGYTTNGVIKDDPLFERGLYLSIDSPALNAGAGTAAEFGLADRCTSTNNLLDTGTVDMGYHFRPGPPESIADSRVALDHAVSELFVAPTGDDSNPGTETEPFRSITHALESATAGSRIHVAGGLYNHDVESFPLCLDKPGIQIQGAGAEDTLVNALGSETRVLQARGVLGDARLEGITLTGASVPKTAVTPGSPTTLLPYSGEAFWHAHRGAGLFLVNCSMDLSDVVCSSNKLRGKANENILGGGIYSLWSWGVMSNIVVVSNVLMESQSNTGEGHGGGIYITGGKWLITHSVISSNLAGFGNNGGNSGGGAYLAGEHTLADSIIAGNLLAGQAGSVRRGGGVFMNGGMIRDCRILTNRMAASTSASANGGGIYLAAGNIRNCLLAHNSAIRDGGALFAINAASRIESVTVAGNHCIEAACVAGACFNGAPAGLEVINCIFAHNYRDFDMADASVSETGATITYSCLQPGREGEGNVSDAPGFINHLQNDYHLAPGSPAIDSALQQPWMETAVDIEGHPRIRNGLPDMGAFEAPGPDEGPLTAGFSGTPLQGMDSLEVTFTATVQGESTTGIIYEWDFNNDGVFDATGSDKQTVLRLYTPGRYSVRLKVSNAASETFEIIRQNYIFVSPSAIYVASDGDNSDGTTWARAFTGVDAALNAACQGNTICLKGETFLLDDTLYWSMQEGVSILGGFQGAGSPGDRDPLLWPTVLRRNSSAGNFRLMYASAIVNGFISGITFADGYTTQVAGSPAPGSGGAMRAGDSSLTLENCIFTNNQCRTSGNSYIWGGAVFAENSNLTVSNCLFANNLAYGGPVASANNRALGGGLAANACNVIIANCRFLRNTADAGGNHGNLGGGLYLSGNTGLVRNTLIAHNRAGHNRPLARAGGICIGPGITLENVTVADNEVWNNGVYYPNTAAGIYADGGGEGRNVISYNNINNTEGQASDIFAPDLAIFSYSCASELGGIGAGNTAADPKFASIENDDYTPLLSSPCRNTGINMDWMYEATDLAGRPRILTGRVDMGAYEIWPAPGSMFKMR